MHPRPLLMRVAGALLVAAGVTAYLLEPLHPAGTMVLILGILLASLAHRSITIAEELTAIECESERALVIIARMEHADPASYHEHASRERVLAALCRHPHYSSKGLGALLHMSSRTVDNYLQCWIKTTGVDNRRQLVTMFEYHYLEKGTDEEGLGAR